MTSRNSFLANMAANLKRRMWCVVVIMLGFFFALPVSLMLSLSSATKYEMPMFVMTRLENIVMNYLVKSPLLLVLTTIFAMLTAIHGFSYLYSRKKTDMYLSAPVSIERRYAVIVVNSILMYVIPFAVFFGITLLIAGTYGINNAYIIKMAFVNFGINVVYFLAIYFITVIAVMMTGNLPVTGLAAGVFLGYENGVKFLLLGLFQKYFRTFTDFSADFFYTSWVSPIGVLVEGYDKFCNIIDIDKKTVLDLAFGKDIIHLAVLAAVFMVISFAVYRIRPAEACHKSMAFEKSKKVVKRLIIVPGALLFGYLFDAASGDSLAAAIFGVAVGTVLIHGVMQTIYDLDLKAVFTDKRSVVYGGVVALVVFSIFRFDIFGYDKYVPSKDKIVSGAVALNLNYLNNNSIYSIENARYINEDEYIMENMVVSDTDILCDVASAAAEEVDFYRRNEQLPSDSREETNAVSATIKYTMANGKDVYRYVVFDYNDNQELLDRLLADKGYKEKSIELYGDVFAELESQFEASFTSGLKEHNIENVSEIVEAYKKDYMQMSFSDLKDKFAVGRIQFYTEVSDAEKTYTRKVRYNFPVFDSFENTLRILEEYNIDVNDYIDPESIISMTVYDYTEEYKEIPVTDPEIRKEILENSVTDVQLNYSAIYQRGKYTKDVGIECKPEAKEGTSYVGTEFFTVFIPDDFDLSKIK